MTADARGERPRVHIISVSYNSARYVPAYLQALEALDYPSEALRLTVVDNASTDGTLSLLRAHRGRLKPVLYAGAVNTGFAAGNNVALRTNRDPYVLFLNLDTEIAPSCLGLLVDRLESDSRSGLAESRQEPHEHPKEYDPVTGETPWCSAACLLARSAALDDTGFFDERFVLYVEDVDLSWRMWATGWKCIYVPSAACRHYTLDLAEHKRGRFEEYYFGFRNGIFMRFIYGSIVEWLGYNARIVKLHLVARDHSPEHKRRLRRALVAQLKHFPHLLTRRRQLQKRKPFPRWIRFHRWDYHRLRTDAGTGPEP